MGSMQPLHLSQKKPNIFFEAYGTIHGSANLEMNSCWLMLTRTVEPGPSLSIKLYLLNGVLWSLLILDPVILPHPPQYNSWDPLLSTFEAM